MLEFKLIIINYFLKFYKKMDLKAAIEEVLSEIVVPIVRNIGRVQVLQESLEELLSALSVRVKQLDLRMQMVE
jgi:hypothetical protein